MSDPEFDCVAVIGLGLIGGSLAAGIRQRGIARKVTAWDMNATSLATGRDLGIIDEAATDVAAATGEADLVILSVPVKAMKSLLAEVSWQGQTVTDVGSVKSQLLDDARAVLGEVPPTLIPGHPIAGSERHGVLAADPALFEQHSVILTPEDECAPAALSQVTTLWQRLGARVVQMSAEHHDLVLARTSHLPHLLAYALVDTLSSGGENMEVFQYAAGGFRDFSRIAASDPTMWSDIFQVNREPLLDILDLYLKELEAFRALLAASDGEAMKKVLARAKSARDHFSSLDQSRHE